MPESNLTFFADVFSNMALFKPLCNGWLPTSGWCEKSRKKLREHPESEGGWMGSGICGHIWRRPSPHGTKLYPHSLSTFTIFSQFNLQSNLKVYPITSRKPDWNFCKTMHNEFFVVGNLEQKYLVSIIPFNIFIGILVINIGKVGYH